MMCILPELQAGHIIYVSHVISTSSLHLMRHLDHATTMPHHDQLQLLEEGILGCKQVHLDGSTLLVLRTGPHTSEAVAASGMPQGQLSAYGRTCCCIGRLISNSQGPSGGQIVPVM